MYYNLMFAATPPRIMRQRQWITFFTASSAQGWNWTTPEPFLYLQTIRPFSRPPIGLFQGHQFSQKEINLFFPKAESSKVKSDFMKYIKYQLYNLNGLTMN